MIAISDYYLCESVDLSKFIANKSSIVQDRIKQFKHTLIQAKVDINNIENIVKRHAKAAADAARARDTRKFTEIVREMFAEIGETGIFPELSISLALTTIVIIVNTFILVFLVNLGFSAFAAFAVAAIFVAPLTEETGKYLSVKYGATGLHYIVFNIAEFIIYLANLIGAGVALPMIIIGRLSAMILHLLVTTLHVRGKVENRSIERGMMAVAIHSIWNFIAMLPHIRF